MKVMTLSFPQKVDFWAFHPHVCCTFLHLTRCPTSSHLPNSPLYPFQHHPYAQPLLWSSTETCLSPDHMTSSIALTNSEFSFCVLYTLQCPEGASKSSSFPIAAPHHYSHSSWKFWPSETHSFIHSCLNLVSKYLQSSCFIPRYV